MKCTLQQAADDCDVREIPLTRGMVALIDAADYELVTTGGKWHASQGRYTFYARRAYPRAGRAKALEQMHHLITGWSFVDHRNGEGLDNRRANLRLATDSQNQSNRRIGTNNTSGYKGVSLDRRRDRWQAYIHPAGRKVSLGCFATPEEAARAYDAGAIEHFGKFARTNFPQGVDL